MLPQGLSQKASWRDMCVIIPTNSLQGGEEKAMEAWT